MSNPAARATGPITEGLVEIDGEGFYAVPDFDRIPPFLMSVVSNGDGWMFVSSSGALTAGRVDSSAALFPYETDDRLHQNAGRVGPVTAIRLLQSDSEGGVWRPFRSAVPTPAHRCLYKSVVGDSVIFEEVHPELRLTFRYRWSSSDEFGFIRMATIVNDGDLAVRTHLVDGLLNILPHGLEPSIYQGLSNLTNAYKRSEIIDSDSRLAVFSLETSVVDRPEPAEVLRGSVVWSLGLDDATVTVSPDSLAAFEAGRTFAGVPLLTGLPGAYLLGGAVDLPPGGETSWHIVADVAQDQIAVANLRSLLRSQTDVRTAVTRSMKQATQSLVEIMAPADALQRTGDRIATAHQFSNVTYNVMRGGVPISGYRINTGDFARFVHERNRRVADRHRTWFESLPEVIERKVLLERIDSTTDVDLLRLGLEYLPFGFSRRHGDPSRPWNAFSIRVRDADGEPVLYFEGNWRDIFQNWEALCMSFPGYLPGVIAAFVNASTPDGFNPYRITRNGIDWEVPDPDDPWSNIGYWGDHQIVYLHRLLEAAERFLPGEVGRLLGERWFTYADVPYRLAPYDQLVRDPKATIHYDEPAAELSAGRVERIGSDGKLLWSGDELYLVTLVEKLLVPALTKLSNFVPGGGIWMNTQRPEWNDANNALVGFGLSMVTLNHLRAYLQHVRSLLDATDLQQVAVSTEVAKWLAAVTSAFQRADPRANVTEGSRKNLMDQLGRAFSDYRTRVYGSGFSGHAPVAIDTVIELCESAMEHLDETIRDSRRPDGLYHSYNLIHFSADGLEASVEHLYEMLEGQVAILSSGLLSPDEQADVIEALFSSEMYRADQGSFLLYPARPLPSFLDKNVVPPEAVSGNQLLAALLEAGDPSIVAVDVDGRYRFNADFANRDDLEATLDRLAGDEHWSNLVSAYRTTTVRTYEAVFRHHAYTGRSGSMYGYEGIGSIYWHMVAKLAVAVQEAALEAKDGGAAPAAVHRLVDAYWRVRSGLGFNKTAEKFGAIPIDPYSHTPSHAGAQQPGMTGLVKEELLTRPLEVGVRVARGRIVFDPLLVRPGELLEQQESWRVYNLDLDPSTIRLEAGSLGMTMCQVPVVVSTTPGEPTVELVYADGTTTSQPGLVVGREDSAAVFARSGEIARIHAHVPDSALEEKQRDI